MSWSQPTAPTAGVPTVPPPHSASGAPRRKRGKGWLITLLVVLAAILTMAITGTVLFVTRTLPPYNAAHDFLDDVNHHRDTSAARRLCSTDSSQPDSAVLGIGSHFRNGKTFSVNPLGVDRSGSVATVDYTVSYQDGSTRTFTLPVVEENGSWKACPL
ncbi:MAG TPA: hypothetical protein VLV81_03295 [Acidimicrobiia bacterium]|nr:hypothetical protein [Acidimicrobiia bacterium]